MAQIPRPPKQGNVLTYVAKVAAGYPHILAGEVDADLDTIYGAWNTGADTVNIRDAAVTSAKLAADAVGPRELADAAVAPNHLSPAAVTTPALADGAVTDPKIASVAFTKVTGWPAQPGTLPPSGPAGGDLVGSTYPNPVIAPGVVTAAKLAPGALTGANLAVGAVGAREIADGSVGTVELVDGAVTRAKLAVNASNSAAVFVNNPTGFVLSTAGVWTTYATLPTLTTRGGAVLLLATPATSVMGPIAAGECNTRWLRDGVLVASGPWNIVAPSPQLCPMPGVQCIDTGAAAGAHVYTYQVLAGTGCTITSGSLPDGGFFAMEIG